MFALADRLSPILIKELRQSLRARVFLYSFFILPAAAAIATGLSVALQMSGDDEFGETFFWVAVGFPMLLSAVPAVLTLRSEIDSRTLELMMLTHLTPWRILLGKWCALAAQCGLFGVVALPFVLIRYFAGGHNPTEDLSTLGAIAGASLFLSAAGMAFSIRRPRLATILTVGLVAVVALPLVGCLAGLALFALTSFLARLELAPLNGLLLSFLLLNWAAGRIATETERIYLTTDRRILFWALLATLTAQSASRIPSLFLTGISAYLHLIAARAFATRMEPASELWLPLIPRRWRNRARHDPGIAGAAWFTALLSLDAVVVLDGFHAEPAILLAVALIIAYGLLHLLPAPAEIDDEEVPDASGA